MNGCMVDMNWPDQTFLLFFELKANLENRDLWFSFPPAIQQFLILLPNFSPARYSVLLVAWITRGRYNIFLEKEQVNGTIRLFKSDWVKKLRLLELRINNFPSFARSSGASIFHNKNMLFPYRHFCSWSERSSEITLLFFWWNILSLGAKKVGDSFL